jgi:hypothetical protein
VSEFAGSNRGGQVFAAHEPETYQKHKRTVSQPEFAYLKLLSLLNWMSNPRLALMVHHRANTYIGN